MGSEALRTPSAARALHTALRPWNLVSALSVGFGGDVASALETVFPGVFREWEVSRLPRERWHDRTLRAEAVQWLLERLGVEPAEVPGAVARGRLTPKVFKDTGLDGLLRVTGSVWRALDDVFPGRFRRWELSAVPRSYWRSRATVREAAEWALARLDLPRADVVPALKGGRLSARELVRLGLGSLVMGVFRGDVTVLLQVAELLPSERYVPLSRYYRQAAAPAAGPIVSWRLRSDRRLSRGMEPGFETELERRMRASRGVREERRRRLLSTPI
jgi:hypothetical protein